MMETIDSKKKKLSLQEIIVRSLQAQQKELNVPLQTAILTVMEELKMPDSEALQLGNTVFITHYSPESPTCMMYALNVDTAKNYINNGEMYTRHLIKKGLTGFMTSYTNESFGVPFKQIEKNKLGIVESFKQGNRFITAVMFKSKKPQEPQNV